METDEFFNMLQQQIDQVTQIGDRIEHGESYMEDLRGYLPELNRAVTMILQLACDPNVPLEIDQGFVLQVLNDIMSGMEQEDGVLLLDVLRYGLLEIYDYVGSELQGGSMG